MHNKIVFSIFLMAIGSLSMYGAQECLIESREEHDHLSDEQIKWLDEVAGVSLLRSNVLAQGGVSVLLQRKRLAQLKRVERDDFEQKDALTKEEICFFKQIEELAQLERVELDYSRQRMILEKEERLYFREIRRLVARAYLSMVLCEPKERKLIAAERASELNRMAVQNCFESKDLQRWLDERRKWDLGLLSFVKFPIILSVDDLSN